MLPAKTDFEAVLKALVNARVEFIVIGGVAALGDVDLLGEVTGGGTYPELLGAAEQVELLGQRCRVVSLEKLIQLKRAAGRPKDLESIAEPQALLEERRLQQGNPPKSSS